MERFAMIAEEELRPLLKDILRELLAENAGGASLHCFPKEPPLSQTELCKFLGVSIPTVIRWRKKGKIPFMTIGSAVRFDKEAVLKALENKKR